MQIIPCKLTIKIYLIKRVFKYQKISSPFIQKIEIHLWIKRFRNIKKTISIIFKEWNNHFLGIIECLFKRGLFTKTRTKVVHKNISSHYHKISINTNFNRTDGFLWNLGELMFLTSFKYNREITYLKI